MAVIPIEPDVSATVPAGLAIHAQCGLTVAVVDDGIRHEHQRSAGQLGAVAVVPILTRLPVRLVETADALVHRSPYAESSTERVGKEPRFGLEQARLGIAGRPRPRLIQHIVVEPGRDQAVDLESIRHRRQPPGPHFIVGVAEEEAVTLRSPDPGIAYRTRTDTG